MLYLFFFWQRCQTLLEYMEYIYFFTSRHWLLMVEHKREMLKIFTNLLFWLLLPRSLIVTRRTGGGVVRFRTMNERFQVQAGWITESIFAVGFSTAPEATCQKGFWSNKLTLLFIFSHYPEGKSVQSPSWEWIALVCEVWWGGVNVVPARLQSSCGLRRKIRSN